MVAILLVHQRLFCGLELILFLSFWCELSYLFLGFVSSLLGYWTFVFTLIRFDCSNIALSMNKINIAFGTFAFNVPWEVIPQLSVSLMFELRDVNVAFWHLLRQYGLVKCFFWRVRTEYLSIYFWIAASHFYQSGLNAHMTQFLTNESHVGDCTTGTEQSCGEDAAMSLAIKGNWERVIEGFIALRTPPTTGEKSHGS